MITGLALVALLAALGCGWLAWTLHRSDQAMLAWPTVPGRIVAIEVAQQRLDSVSPRANSAGHVYWEVLVRYEYEAGGRRHLGRQLSNRPPRVRAGASQEPPAELVSWLQRYPVGSAVSVRHHPTRAERSTLEVDTGGARYFAIGAAAALLVAAALGAWLAGSRAVPPQ